MQTLTQVYNKASVNTMIERDLSEDVSRIDFFQLDNHKLLNLKIFFFQNINLAKYNYEIYDKELLAIIKIFKKQIPKLNKIGMLIKVNINQKNLEYFRTTKTIIKEQAC